jgi:hypothetical protein
MNQNYLYRTGFLYGNLGIGFPQMHSFGSKSFDELVGKQQSICHDMPNK